MNKLKLIIGCVSVAFITGCAAPRYDGPGTFQDFANARYQCIKELRGLSQGNAAVVNKVSIGGDSDDISCSGFAACLASKGYFKNTNGKFDTSSISVTCSIYK